MEEGDFQHQKAQKKFRAPGENQTHDPPSSSSDGLTTELLEALWRAGSKLCYNYTRGIFKLGGLARMILLLPTGPSQLLSSCLTVKMEENQSKLCAPTYEREPRNFTVAFLFIYFFSLSPRV